MSYTSTTLLARFQFQSLSFSTHAIHEQHQLLHSDHNDKVNAFRRCKNRQASDHWRAIAHLASAAMSYYRSQCTPASKRKYVSFNNYLTAALTFLIRTICFYTLFVFFLSSLSRKFSMFRVCIQYFCPEILHAIDVMREFSRAQAHSADSLLSFFD